MNRRRRILRRQQKIPPIPVIKKRKMSTFQFIATIWVALIFAGLITWLIIK